jgi:hypothetical protein
VPIFILIILAIYLKETRQKTPGPAIFASLARAWGLARGPGARVRGRVARKKALAIFPDMCY